MSFHRADFALTVDAFGHAEVEVRLSGVPSLLNRHAFLEAVFLDDTGLGGVPDLVIRQVDVDPTDQSETDGDTLFYADASAAAPDGYYVPRVATVDQSALAITNGENGRALIRTASLKAEIDLAPNFFVAGQTATVYVYYETAGDFRW